MSPWSTLQFLADDLACDEKRVATSTFQKEAIEQRTYVRLREDVEQLASGLKSKGIECGQHVAVMARNGYEWIVTALAVLRAGAVVVPIDIQIDDHILRHILRDSTARLLFTTSDQCERLQRLDIPECPLYLFDAPDEEPQSWRRLFCSKGHVALKIAPDDPAVLFYTSGTTGFPKGVPLSHANMAFQLNTLKAADLVCDVDRVLLPLPLHHVYPFVVGMLVPLSMGIPIIFPQSITGPQIVRALKEGAVTVVIGVPRLYRVLYEGIVSRIQSQGKIKTWVFNVFLQMSFLIYRLSGWRVGKILFSPLHKKFGENIRLMASGGSALHPDLHRKLEAIGWQVAIGYGLTETSPLLTLKFPGPAHIGSVGKPIAGVDIDIQPGADNQGEVLARGPGVFASYRHLPRESQEAFTPAGWFKTGDLGYFDNEGYLYLTGRVSTMIVTESGKNIQPDDVEELYLQNPLISEIGVLERDRKLAAVILPNQDMIQQRGLSVKTAVHEAVMTQSQKMPSYQRISDYVITRESLPRTRLGKICRHLLPGCYEQAKEAKTQKARPIAFAQMSDEDQGLLENPEALKVWTWLAERYHDQRLTPDSSPQLDLGIDSLEWVNLTLDIRQLLAIELTEEAVGRIKTVRDLLKEVAEQSLSGKGLTAEILLEQPESILSDKQKRWLKPLSPLEILTARGLFYLNGILMKWVFRLNVQGREHLPAEGPFIIAPNHVSYLDPPAVGAALSFDCLKNTYWAGLTDVVFVNVVMRSISRLAKVVPIDPQRAAASSLAFGAAALKAGNNLIWFPEGGRSPTGELLPFKAGLGILLHRFKVPVVPVWIYGSYAAWPVHRKWPRPHAITVVFSKPVDAKTIEGHIQADRPAESIMHFLYEHMKAIEASPGRE